MNRQEIFDKVLDHLRTQGKPAVESIKGICQYLTNDGRKCAIGCLIPEGSTAFNTKGNVNVLLERNPELKELWGVNSDNDVEFLLTMQGVHDNQSNWNDEGFNAKGEWVMKEIRNYYVVSATATL